MYYTLWIVWSTFPQLNKVTKEMKYQNYRENSQILGYEKSFENLKANETKAEKILEKLSNISALNITF